MGYSSIWINLITKPPRSACTTSSMKECMQVMYSSQILVFTTGFVLNKTDNCLPVNVQRLPTKCENHPKVLETISDLGVADLEILIEFASRRSYGIHEDNCSVKGSGMIWQVPGLIKATLFSSDISSVGS